jgi:hypothetical protein
MTVQLTPAQRLVLEATMRSDRTVGDSGLVAIVSRSGLPSGQVRQALGELEALVPPLVRREVDERLGIEFWLALVDASEALRGDA